MRIRLTFLLFLSLSIAVTASAQKRPPSTNGNTNTPNVFSRPATRDLRVEIQVTDENSQPLYNAQLMVELTSFGGGSQRTYTNQDGRASFSVRSGATYQITVSGQEIETASNSFELYPDEQSHRESISVKFKKSATSQVPGGIVSASNLNIPAKARQEFSKGLEEMNRNKWQDAKKHFEKAIHEYPDYDSAYNNLGVVQIQLKENDAARQAFLKAVELNDKNADATANLAQIKIGENDYEAAKELLKKSLIVQPQNPKTLTLLAFAQVKSKEYSAALANAEKVHQGDIDHFPLAHFIAARIREGQGDQAGAERQYQAYLKESPDGPEAAMAKEGLIRLQAKK